MSYSRTTVMLFRGTTERRSGTPPASRRRISPPPVTSFVPLDGRGPTGPRTCRFDNQESAAQYRTYLYICDVFGATRTCLTAESMFERAEIRRLSVGYRRETSTPVLGIRDTRLLSLSGASPIPSTPVLTRMQFISVVQRRGDGRKPPHTAGDVPPARCGMVPPVATDSEVSSR